MLPPRLRRSTGLGRLAPSLILLILVLVAVALPPAPTTAAAYTPEITRVRPGKGRVALTFDGDAFAGRTWDIINTLQAYQAHATFFLTGHYLNTFPTRVRGLVAAGQEVASHGYEHRDYRGLSAAGITTRLAEWEATYYALTGRYGPAFWRAPYGYSDSRVRGAAAAAGYDTIYWTLDSLDTIGPPKSQAFIYNRLTRSGVTLDGAILLLHVNPDGTINALPRVLASLEARGLDVVSVSGLLAR